MLETERRTNMWNNRVILSGNLVKDVEVKVTEGKDSKHVTSFTVAVHRTRSKEDTADFINCVAWGVQADYLGNYGKKGSRIELEGQLHARSYEKDGKKIYVTEVYVDDCHLQKKSIGKQCEESESDESDEYQINLNYND